MPFYNKQSQKMRMRSVWVATWQSYIYVCMYVCVCVCVFAIILARYITTTLTLRILHSPLAICHNIAQTLLFRMPVMVPRLVDVFKERIATLKYLVTNTT